MDIERVSPDVVVDRAVTLVLSAQKTILATELLSDKPQSLPEKYITVVREKLASGFLLQRIAFGTSEQLQKFHDLNRFDQQNYSCWLAPPALYQRMLTVDEQQMLFALQLGTEKMFCFSSSQAVIQDFRKYFQLLVSNQPEVSQVF